MIDESLVSCSECSLFEKDLVGFGDGIGECRVYQHYADKGEPMGRLRVLLMKLGNEPDYPLFWGGSRKGRKCEKFKPVAA
ncbi:MAG: hypothetical protein ACXWAT_00505 [Methylobacter sp.]